MKKIVFFLFLLFLTIKLLGQSYNASIPIMSPEVASLGKFGAYPVSYYTGIPNINIPLYQLRVHKIKIPITLQYDASGFMPNKDSGKVGHDWTLCAGGIITRSVNIIPDDIQADLADPEDYRANGHWYAIRGLNKKLNEDSVRTLKYITTSASDNINFETTPDMFTFNFGEYHGQFIIAHDGTPKVISDGNYHIDLQNFAIQKMNNFTTNSRIVITTDDGTKYTFGGTPDALEISLKVHRENGNIQDYAYNGTINGFYLTKIETIDGEIIDFIYRKYSNQYSKYVDNDNVVKNRYYTDVISNIYSYSNTYLNSNGVSNECQYTFTKVAYISAIHSSVGTITFNYNTKEQPFCPGTTYWRNNTLRLDNISIADSRGKNVKSIKFDQTFFPSKDTKSFRMFLTNILCGKEKYSFTYADQNNFPAPETRGIDLRGYYNGNDNNVTLLPIGYSNINNDPNVVDFSHRQPNLAAVSKGMLSRITYPTGGYTEFDFENHHYGTVVRKSFNRLYPDSYELSGLVGGLRIKQIKSVPGETRTFEYKMEGGNDSISSGVFNDFKKYALLAHFSNIGWGITTWFIAEGNNIVHANSFSESDIVYASVIERSGIENGKKVYDYSTYNDFKDAPLLDSSTYSFYNEKNVSPEQSNLLLSMRAYTSNQIKRGKLLRLREYVNEDIMPKRETIYTYSVNGTEQTQAVYSAEVRLLIYSMYGICNSQAFYYYPYQLTRKEIKEYSGLQYITQQTNYTYNIYNKLPQSISTTNSDNSVYRTEYSYPVDSTSVTVNDEMVKKFMVSPIINEKHYMKNILIKTQRYHYKLYQNKFYSLYSIEQAIGNNPFRTLVTFHDYDKRQNILSLTEIDKPTVSFIWGYNYQYPLVKLVNTSLSSVRNVLSTSLQESIADANELSIADSLKLDNICSNLPLSQTTMYNYKPLVGMTFMRDPNMLQHHYTYDIWGRLQNVFTEHSAKQVTYNYVYKSSTPALSACFSDLSSSYEQGVRIFAVNITNGSGLYKYEWNLNDNVGKSLFSSTSAVLSYTFTTSGFYTLTCIVTDLIKQESVTVNRTFMISAYRIQFSNISEVRDNYLGNYTMMATISCAEATSLSFLLDCRSGGGQCTVKIGNNTYSDTSRRQQEFSQVLQAGNTQVEIKCTGAIATPEVELCITSANNYEIGMSSCLYLQGD